jgi:hypothetical protein
MDHSRAGSPEELKQHNLDNVRQAVSVLKTKATDEEVEEYRKFIVGLAERVAEARKEGFMGLSGERVSDAERAAIGEIEACSPDCRIRRLVRGCEVASTETLTTSQRESAGRPLVAGRLAPSRASGSRDRIARTPSRSSKSRTGTAFRS